MTEGTNKDDKQQLLQTLKYSKHQLWMAGFLQDGQVHSGQEPKPTGTGSGRQATASLGPWSMIFYRFLSTRNNKAASGLMVLSPVSSSPAARLHERFTGPACSESLLRYYCCCVPQGHLLHCSKNSPLPQSFSPPAASRSTFRNREQ